MGFFDKIKQSMNIGGVSVKLVVPATVERHAGAISGEVTVTTKSIQTVKRLSITVEEVIVKDEQLGQPISDRRSLELGKIDFSEPFTLQPDEVKTIPFTVQFAPEVSVNEDLKAGGGPAAALGVLGNMMDQTRRTWTVNADADVDNAALDATDSVSINLV